MTPTTDAERIRKDGERAARSKNEEKRAWGERLLALADEIEAHLREMEGDGADATDAVRAELLPPPTGSLGAMVEGAPDAAGPAHAGYVAVEGRAARAAD